MVVSMNCIVPVLLAVIEPHSITLPPPCLTVGVKCWVSSADPGFRQTICLPSDPNRLILVSSVNITLFQNSCGFPTYSFANASRFFIFTFESSGFFRATRPLRLFLWATRRMVSALTVLPTVSENSFANFGILVLEFFRIVCTISRSSPAVKIRFRRLPVRFFSVPLYFHLLTIFCTVECNLPTEAAISRSDFPRQHMLIIRVRVAISVSFLLDAIFKTTQQKSLPKQLEVHWPSN